MSNLRKAFPNVPFLALTATATAEVIQDICRSLCLKDPAVRKSSFDRPNLVLLL